ncbi:predicted protein [Sclerotinia sclerotiorum 1980 UF-70]|uniref:Uncharacterized protein n=1 Tax=Sclerotinia sclerotiorum (strain ATCC 18683 / 1980 / Ss-1) TaxID=665079 RepID=A7E528_SCLS1|nr:predicted protein [Sclerotinia sclerotiorum 1980 UF-70]EDN91000.1 predicted protein [Sclerotinia sclerotiorum 1980 UF-70]
MPDLKYDTEIWQRQQNRSHDSFGAVKSPVYKLLSLGTESRQLRMDVAGKRLPMDYRYTV